MGELEIRNIKRRVCPDPGKYRTPYSLIPNNQNMEVML